MAKPLRSLRLSPKSDYTRFTGVRGEIFYDPVNDTLRVFDSQTQGGEIMATRNWVLANSSDLTVNSLSSDSDINIDINLADSTLQRWRFGEDGELTFPDGSSQSTAWTGSITALSNLEALSFGRGVTVAEFSSDATFTDNSIDTVPTESAIRGYIDRRLGWDQEGQGINPVNKIGPTYVFTSGQQTIDLSSSSSTADGNATFNAEGVMLASWIASLTTTRSLNIVNLTAGRFMKIYVRNTNGSSRVVQINASATAEGLTPVNLAAGAGAVSVSQITLAATSGSAVITVWNTGSGTIVGMVN
jgi:hypothetical protein